MKFKAKPSEEAEVVSKPVEAAMEAEVVVNSKAKATILDQTQMFIYLIS